MAKLTGKLEYNCANIIRDRNVISIILRYTTIMTSKSTNQYNINRLVRICIDTIGNGCIKEMIWGDKY